MIECTAQYGTHLCAYLNGHAGQHQCACSTEARWRTGQQPVDYSSMSIDELLKLAEKLGV